VDELGPIEIDQKTFLRDHCALPALPKLVSQIQEIMQSDKLEIKLTRPEGLYFIKPNGEEVQGTLKINRNRKPDNVISIIFCHLSRN